MDEELKPLMQGLGNAINESLSDSERIAEAIGAIRRAGYNVFLILEVTIGFGKMEQEPTALLGPASSESTYSKPQKVMLTGVDGKFLSALHISLPEDGSLG